MIPAHGTHSRYSTKKYLCRCNRCKRAASEYQRQRRAARPDVREQNRLQNYKRYVKVQGYLNRKKDAPCTDCDIKYPPYVMQFDHIGNDKEFTISQSKRSIELIDKEIAKCELVCANCHMERTHQRRLAQALDKKLNVCYTE